MSGATLGSPGASLGALPLGVPSPPPAGPNRLVRNPTSNWNTGYEPPVVGAVPGQIIQSELAQLDAQLSGSINGDDGSTHAPAVNVELTGQGATVTGPTVIQQGATLQALSNPTISLQNNDFPQLVAGSNTHTTHSFLQPCFDAVGNTRTTWHVRREDSGLQAFSASFDLSDGFGQRTSIAFMRLRPHDGSTLSSVTVSFRVGAAHAQLPATMPRVGVLCYLADGTLVGSLTSAAAGADTNGLVAVAKPSSASAWYANGAAQAVTIPCDQNNLIDVSKYFYKLEIAEEFGLAGYPWQLTYTKPVRVTCAPPWYAAGIRIHEGLLDVAGAPLALDGVTIADGDRVLFNSSLPAAPVPFGLPPLQAQTQYGYLPPPPATFDGIWTANAHGPWFRANDFRPPAPFPVGMVVPVLQGAAYAGSFWQVSTAATAWPNGQTLAGLAFSNAFQITGVQQFPVSGTFTQPTNFPFTVPTCTPTNLLTYVYPSKPNGYLYQLTTQATLPINRQSGYELFEPVWPTDIGATVHVRCTDTINGNVDSGAVYTCIGRLPDPLTVLPRPDMENPAEGSGFIAHGIVWHSARLTHTNIKDMRWQ